LWSTNDDPARHHAQGGPVDGGTIALLAPADAADAELDETARQAREEIDAGAVAEVPGPVTGTVEVDGRKLAYATLGTEGDVVVLVHGYGDGSLDTLADSVLGFLDALGIERAHLVGHSLGGAVVTAATASGGS
jgi:pyruvate dehydrogenase E2 component (dihydrolipoamide acetyltransferase)